MNTELKELIINDNEYIIKSYRHHKNFDMVTLNTIDSIESAEELKGLSIYIDRETYKFNGYLDEDLIGLNAYDDNIFKGKIVEILFIMFVLLNSRSNIASCHFSRFLSV